MICKQILLHVGLLALACLFSSLKYLPSPIFFYGEWCAVVWLMWTVKYKRCLPYYCVKFLAYHLILLPKATFTGQFFFKHFLCMKKKIKKNEVGSFFLVKRISLRTLFHKKISNQTAKWCKLWSWLFNFYLNCWL